MALEDLEHSAQESMREQHPRRSHLDEYDIAFSGNCAHWTVRRVESNACSFSLRLSRIVDEYGNSELHRRSDRVVMENLRTERSELGRLVEPDLLDEQRAVHHARVGGEHAIDIG